MEVNGAGNNENSMDVDTTGSANNSIQNGDDSATFEGDNDILLGEKEFTFTINDFRKLSTTPTENLLSEAGYCRNLPWKMLVTCRTGETTPKRTIGAFFQCNAIDSQTNWSCHAQAEIRLVAQNKPSGNDDIVKQISHIFHAKENDWGFSNFVSWSELHDVEKGYLKNDSLLFRVKLSADPPLGCDWDSRKYTGFVGLKNQGATCYMNSLLQTLFFTNKLRKAVYFIPTSTDEMQKSVPLALQRVFYELQTSNIAVATKRLTRSFGWDTYDSFMQHDVQELCRVLLDNIETKMKNTPVEGTIPSLFKGKFVSYIKCLHVDYKSEREEDYYDLQLNVKGCQGVMESLEQYVQTETLDGNNKYEAGQHGLQAAEKGVSFKSFPPVLYFQLLRFTYDPHTSANVKINDRYEYPEKINLSKFHMNKENATPNKMIYRLQSVLVHSGDNHGGHYVVFISPKCDGKWFKFDDEIVSPCKRNEALDYNYGGDSSNFATKSNSSAYMLVYVNEAKLNDVLCEVTNENVPQNLRSRLDDEIAQEESKRRERDEAHLFVTCNIVTDEDIRLLNNPIELWDETSTPKLQLRLQKTIKVKQLVETIGEKLNTEAYRVWFFEDGQARPRHLKEEMDEKQIGSCFNVFTFFVEMLPRCSQVSVLTAYNSENDVLLFTKYYSPINSELSFVGSLVVNKFTKLSMLHKTLLSMLGDNCEGDDSTALSRNNTKFLFFHEDRDRYNAVPTVPLNDRVPLMSAISNLSNGAVIIFQPELIEDGKTQIQFPSVTEYMTNLHDMIKVSLIELKDRNKLEEKGIEVTLNQSHRYQDFVSDIATKFGFDAEKLQLFRPTPAQLPQPIHPESTETLKDYFPARSRPKKLFYQLLKIPVRQLAVKCHFRLVWLTDDHQEIELDIFPPKMWSVRELVLEAMKVRQFEGKLEDLRVVEVLNCRYHVLIDKEKSISDVNMRLIPESIIRIEEIPESEVMPPHQPFTPSNMKLVPCAHFQKDPNGIFGSPFFMLLRKEMTWAEVKQQVQQKLNILDREFEKYKLYKVDMSGQQFSLSSDEKVDLNMFISPMQRALSDHPWLGIEHLNKSIKRTPKFGTLEKAIKIHN